MEVRTPEGGVCRDPHASASCVSTQFHAHSCKFRSALCIRHNLPHKHFEVTSIIGSGSVRAVTNTKRAKLAVCDDAIRP